MKTKLLIAATLGAVSLANAYDTPLSSELQGVLIEKLNDTKLTLRSRLSSITLEIDLIKKDILAQIERDGSKELADFTERKNDLEFFKEKYSNNMYAKTALTRIEQEEKDLVFMHDKYMKQKEEKIKQLMEENYVPEKVADKGTIALVLKRKIQKIDAALELNIKNYESAVTKAKEDLRKSNDLLLKEIELIK